MTGGEGPDSDDGPYDGPGDAPGWGSAPAPGATAFAPPGPPGPPGVDDAPLTPLQQAVVDEVAKGQHALGIEERWARRSSIALDGGLYNDGLGGSFTNAAVDNLLAQHADDQIDDAQRAAELAAAQSAAPAGADPHFPAGGPPTPEEIHEAEMHPWPHHGMAETIEHNRELRAAAGGSGADDGSPGAPPTPG
jgi:hypothetical protein